MSHAGFDGPQSWTPVILGVDIIERAGQGDHLEFLLQVVWTDRGRLAVTAEVNVACWCATDHATHGVDPLSLVTGDETSLPRAFQAGAERLATWLAGPRNADD
ncbi:hypothetical protein [Streptomyces mesophilus]|uniref:hypothetical protein n=1 Tax=Streptomyces mesophilus TaxID=1775132 RepID=UPI00331D4A8A